MPLPDLIKLHIILGHPHGNRLHDVSVLSVHLWPLVLHPPPSLVQPVNLPGCHYSQCHGDQFLEPSFGMGDQEHYHVGGQVEAGKHQEFYQYSGGGGHPLGVQYAHCSTEQRFQVKSFGFLKGRNDPPSLLCFSYF